MKTKNFTLIFASVFALLLLVGFASAAVTNITLSVVGDGEFSSNPVSGENSTTHEFNFVINNQNDTYTSINVSFSGNEYLELPSGNSTVSLGDNSFSGNIIMPDSTYAGYRVITAYFYDNSDDSLIDTDTLRVYYNSTKEESEVPTGTGWCEYNSYLINEDLVDVSDGLDEIEMSVDIKNNGEGEDDEWYALDTIKIEVELENNFDDEDDMDLKDVTLVLGIYNQDDTDFSENLAEDMIWISTDDEEVDLGNLNGDKKISHIFEFRVNPEDFEEDDYILMVKAYTKEDPADVKEGKAGFCLDYSSDLGEDYYTSISMEGAEDDGAIIVDVDSLPKPLEASCEQKVVITVDVWNVGEAENELGNDYVLVNLYNTELGIDLWQLIDGDLDAGDYDTVMFEFELPSGLTEKSYALHFKTYYDYDEDEDEMDWASYDESSDGTFDAGLLVSGNCAVAKAQVNANLQEGGKAGEPLVVKATIVNSGSNKATYSLNVAGYADWASSANLDATTIVLESGESQEVLITLNVNKDASGDKTFDLEILSEGQVVTTQPVQVSIEGKTGLSSLLKGENSRLWLIGILNLILVVVIIIIAVRVARK